MSIHDTDFINLAKKSLRRGDRIRKKFIAITNSEKNADIHAEFEIYYRNAAILAYYFAFNQVLTICRKSAEHETINIIQTPIEDLRSNPEPNFKKLSLLLEYSKDYYARAAYYVTSDFDRYRAKEAIALAEKIAELVMLVYQGILRPPNEHKF